MCEFCEEEKDLEVEGGYIGVFKGENKLYVSIESAWESLGAIFKINYCPICGRKLSDDND